MIGQVFYRIFKVHPCVAVALILYVGFYPYALQADNSGVGAVAPDGQINNSNALLLEYKGLVVVTASSFWDSWGPERVVDTDMSTSWFSAHGDAAALGTNPWLQVELPIDETVRRVSLLGNRESYWPVGFSILEGFIEFFDRDGKRLWTEEQKATGNKNDFDFRPKTPIRNVSVIRFTSIQDEGDQNIYEDIAMGEIQIE